MERVPCGVSDTSICVDCEAVAAATLLSEPGRRQILFPKPRVSCCLLSVTPPLLQSVLHLTCRVSHPLSEKNERWFDCGRPAESHCVNSQMTNPVPSCAAMKHLDWKLCNFTMHYFGWCCSVVVPWSEAKKLIHHIFTKGYRIQNEKSSGTNQTVFHLYLLCHSGINGDISTSEVWYQDNFIVEMYPSHSKRHFFEKRPRKGLRKEEVSLIVT